MIETFKGYRLAVSGFASYPLVGRNVIYPVLGLVGEAGELADKIKKHYRNSYSPAPAHGILESMQGANNANAEVMSSYSFTKNEIQEIIKEMGDVLWYLDALAKEFGTTLDEVATVNADKLSSRAARGVIKSEGDNR